MPRPLRFVILCLGRTGSTHLQSMLDFHSQARCHGEIFGEGKPPTFASSGGSDPQEFLDLMLAPDRRAGGRLQAADAIDPARPRRRDHVALSDRDLAAIRLSRRNRLSQLVSRRLLASTGVSQSIFGSYGDATRADRAAGRRCGRSRRMSEEEQRARRALPPATRHSRSTTRSWARRAARAAAALPRARAGAAALLVRAACGPARWRRRSRTGTSCRAP